jgi:hypothetical protein
MLEPPFEIGAVQVNLITDLEVTVGSFTNKIGELVTSTITPPLPRDEGVELPYALVATM